MKILWSAARQMPVISVCTAVAQWHTHIENIDGLPTCRQTRHLKISHSHCMCHYQLVLWWQCWLQLTWTSSPAWMTAATAAAVEACSTCTGSSCAVKTSQSDWTSWGNVHIGKVSLRCEGDRAQWGDVCAWRLCHRLDRRMAADLSSS